MLDDLFFQVLSLRAHDLAYSTGDEHHMTTVQGDGLTISTPTGSTAYSVRRLLIGLFCVLLLIVCYGVGFRRRIACPSRDPSHPHHAHLSAHTVVQTDAPAGQHGGPDLCTLQFEEHGLGIIRWTWTCGVETYVGDPSIRPFFAAYLSIFGTRVAFIYATIHLSFV